MKFMSLLLAVVLISGLGCGDRDAATHDPESPARPVALEASIPEPDSTTRRLYDEVMAYARENDLHERPVGEIMTALGERFMGKPYETGMLDVPGEERLICRLDAFDCVTFVESALAMARGIKQEDYSYQTWARHMLDQRYRDGELEGYCSRLHYFSEWILDNEERGTVENITEEIGGVPLEKEIDFMTEHRESYPRFATNDSLFQCIEQMEDRLRNTEIHYIPQDRISETYDQLRAGDVVAMVAGIKGLDVTHTGMVYDSGGGKKGLLHASTSGGVKVSPDLQSYVQGVDSQIGIIVARPQAPSKS